MGFVKYSIKECLTCHHYCNFQFSSPDTSSSFRRLRRWLPALLFLDLTFAQLAVCPLITACWRGAWDGFNILLDSGWKSSYKKYFDTTWRRTSLKLFLRQRRVRPSHLSPLRVRRDPPDQPFDPDGKGVAGGGGRKEEQSQVLLRIKVNYLKIIKKEVKSFRNHFAGCTL